MNDTIYLNNRVLLKVGDIVKEKSEAIVNAANSSLMGGGGVDGAIHTAGGSAILNECKVIRNRLPNGLQSGEAVITTGGKLFSKYVIHTVGPIWRGGYSFEPILLANCYKNSLKIAVDKQIQTITFPAISTGIFGYPSEQAAQVASKTITDFLSQNESIIQVRLIFFQPRDKELFNRHCQF